MEFERALEIVIKARDDATRELKRIGAETDSLSESFKKNLSAAGAMSGGVLASLGLMTRAAVDNAASYEQNRIAFESMLGSADKARSLLKQVSDFAAKTPFELPQVVEGAQKLLAYNVAAKDVIPTFKMLGDLAAGVGTDKLPQLILAFGQVKAATKLTGMELRQFSEAGVPILKALTDELNKNRGGLVRVSQGASLSADKLQKLNTNLAITRKQLEEATASGKAKESTLMRLRARIADYEGQLASATSATTTFARQTKLTERDVLELVSKGEIGFETVQKALQGMTAEGGKFFNLMDKQSRSFSGVMSNIRDSFGRFVRDIVGISEQGDIREGSLFAALRDGAQRFLVTLDQLRPQVVALVNGLVQNRAVLIALAGAFGGLIVLALGAFVAAFGPALAVMTAFAAAGAGIALVLTNLDAVLRAVVPALATAAGAIGVLNLATLGLRGSVAALFGLIAAHPLGLLVTALAGAAFAVGYLATQTDLLKTKDQLLKEAQDELKRSTEELTGHQRTLEDLYRRLDGLGLSVERAQRNYNQAVHQFGPDSLEAREAMHQIKELQAQFRDIQTDVNAQMAKSPEILKRHDDALRKSNEVAKASKTTWEGIRDAIGGALSRFAEWNEKAMKFGFGVGLPRFADGGWVRQTGPAIVHAGEFVLSRDMLAGRAPVPSTVTTNRNANVSIGPVYVRQEADVESLAQRMAYHLQTAGNL